MGAGFRTFPLPPQAEFTQACTLHANACLHPQGLLLPFDPPSRHIPAEAPGVSPPLCGALLPRGCIGEPLGPSGHPGPWGHWCEDSEVRKFAPDHVVHGSGGAQTPVSAAL